MLTLILLQTIIPIPMHAGGGKLPPNALLAIYISVIVFTVAGMFARMLVIMRNEDFKKQSMLKNFFYELDGYTYIKPNLNIGSMLLIFINVSALLVAMIDFLIKIL